MVGAPVLRYSASRVFPPVLSRPLSSRWAGTRSPRYHPGEWDLLPAAALARQLLGQTFEEQLLGVASEPEHPVPFTSRYMAGLPAGILAKAVGATIGRRRGTKRSRTTVRAAKRGRRALNGHGHT